MRSAQLVQSRHASNIAILELARTTYDGIHLALMRRITGGLPSGSLNELPIALIDALATSQGHQNTILATCARSAQLEAAAGAARGVSLAHLFSDDALYEMRAVELIENETFPV